MGHVAFSDLANADVTSPGGSGGATLDASHFGVRANDQSDATPGVRDLLAHALRTKAKRIIFPQGTYHFWPEHAAEQFIYVSNNDASMKRIAFHLVGFSALEIDGQGSQFFFHGQINPFILQRSSGITLRNFSIDWMRPFHNEGLVVADGAEGITVRFPEQFPYKVEGGLLHFLDESGNGAGLTGRDPLPIGRLLEFDPKRRETAYRVRDFYRSPVVAAASMSDGTVRILEPEYHATVGNVVCFTTPYRYCPAVVLDDCKDIQLRQITIHHSGGMGVIAQRSENISLTKVQVTPSSGRVVSLTADATHFVNCRGLITIDGCLFENQMDDATNIHGIYGHITQKLSPTGITIRLVHQEQQGVRFLAANDTAEFVRKGSMATYGESTVHAVTWLNANEAHVEFTFPLPADLKLGDAIGCTSTKPDVLIQNCRIRGNRARGLLLGSRGRITVKNNYFHTAGAAIMMGGDANHWFEQGGVRDLHVLENEFDSCKYGVWGKAVIESAPVIDKEQQANVSYDRNITIEKNQFRILSDAPVMQGYSIDNLAVHNNAFTLSDAYPLSSNTRTSKDDLFKVTNSNHISIDQKICNETTSHR